MSLVFIRGTTPTIVTYPRLDAGWVLLHVPSNAEVRVSTSSTEWPSESTGWTSCTVDDLDETTTADANEGERFLAIDPADLVRGRNYLVSDDSGTFVVSCESVGATGLHTGEPLRRDVATGATVSGWAITHTLTADETDLVGHGVAHFKAEVGGVDCAWTVGFRVARRQAVIPLTSSELVRTYPAIKSLHARQDETLEQLIAAAWEHVLMPRILLRSTWPEDIVNAEVLAPALAAACMLHAARQERSTPQEFVDRWSAEFDRQVETAQGRIDWHESGQEENPSITPDPADRRRGVRLTR